MKDFKEKLKPNVILATYIIVLSYVLLNFEKVWNLLSSGLGILTPFIGAIGIAFVLNIPMTLIEKFILFPLESRKYEKFQKLKRPLAIILTLILIIGLLITLMVFVIPQLVKSMSTLTESIPRYLNSFEHMIDQNLSNIPGADKLINDILSMWKDVLQFASEFLGVAVSHVLDFTISVTSGIVTFFLALIFSIYMLANKEKLSLTLKKFIYAHLKIKFADKLLEIGSLSNDIFSKFIGGQCLEGCIIGTLCTIGMLILGLPYALLIGVIIGVTSLIPIFGAFIGTIPAMFI
ncbi:AI-2E family transporter, partial [Clostridium chrysemydis]|uniref:AI-2E family transporter n=1 Tax=Clostridium chrysemydis TaxID=2665504 RepID=UPI003F2E0D44